MNDNNNSRRAFLKKSSLSGLGAAIGAGSLSSLFASNEY
ncbi:MAG: twin-arginine translocation signal domain-containing protein [Bacteroidetes bacterium]|nr:twin-arginine translocation signal domain-containing protein [Bacteroidota bacterium]